VILNQEMVIPLPVYPFSLFNERQHLAGSGPAAFESGGEKPDAQPMASAMTESDP
jgi:hypothetical protein